MITMQSWMFLISFESLRTKLLNQKTLISLAHLGPRAFDSIGGEVVSTVAFVLKNASDKAYKSSSVRLVEGRNEQEKMRLFAKAIKGEMPEICHLASATDFKKIPGSPFAYWASERIKDAFNRPKIESLTISDGQTKTGDNDKYLRCLWEVNASSIGVDNKWVKHPKGGGFRRWYGNVDNLIDWSETARKHYRSDRVARILPEYLWWKKGFCWTLITTGKQSFRIVSNDEIFNLAAPTLFPKNEADLFLLLGLVNTPITEYITKLMNPTINMNVGEIQSIPLVDVDKNTVDSIVKSLVDLSGDDWNFYETSWDFTNFPLLSLDCFQPTLKATYQKLRAHWREMALEMQRLEEENNSIFIDAYGLQDELTPEVPLNEITLTCNPHYRYGVEECEVGSEKWEEMEARLLQDTMKELVSYAVGCMFGRYSLDMPGLVLANQGETFEDYQRKIEGYRSNEREKLPGTDRLAEGDGFGGVDLSSDQKLSQGGTVRSDESDSQGGSVDSLKHSGGSGEAINGGVQKFSVDSTGFPSRSGNPTDDRSTPGLPPAGESGANPESVRGNQTHDLRPDSETVLTSHSPLPTSHLSFVPDEDNVIPMLDGDWFSDDIAERFRQFLRVAFGEDHYEENLQFVEQSLNIKGKRNYSIRDYFLGEFYTDHVKLYKKRPIYWLISSPKGSFNALIYMHRYRPDTVSVVLNDYLREFRTKLTAHKSNLEAVSISGSASQGEKTKAFKEIESLRKIIDELDGYERDILYPLATEQLEIDLDDGVKVNYPKFGAALKKIAGLDAAED